MIVTTGTADDWATGGVTNCFGGGKPVVYPCFQPGSHDGCDVSYGNGLGVYCVNIAETDMSVHDCTNDYCYSEKDGYGNPFDSEDYDE